MVATFLLQLIFWLGNQFASIFSRIILKVFHCKASKVSSWKGTVNFYLKTVLKLQPQKSKMIKRSLEYQRTKSLHLMVLVCHWKNLTHFYSNKVILDQMTVLVWTKLILSRLLQTSALQMLMITQKILKNLVKWILKNWEEMMFQLSHSNRLLVGVVKKRKGLLCCYSEKLLVHFYLSCLFFFVASNIEGL